MRLKVLALLVLVGVCIASCVHAEEVGKSAFDKLIGWLSKTVGGAVVAIGIVWTGIMMAQHDPDALKKGIWVIIGGILIFLAQPIVSMIRGWTSGM